MLARREALDPEGYDLGFTLTDDETLPSVLALIDQVAAAVVADRQQYCRARDGYVAGVPGGAGTL